MSRDLDLARAYVDRSNEHDLDAVLAMFGDDATYRSSQVGVHEGRAAIAAMVRAFFARFPDAFWDVREYRSAGDLVEFDFVMRGTDATSGETVERRGVERVGFDAAGRIRRVEVEVDAVDTS